jgi:hypothetical protein
MAPRPVQAVNLAKQLHAIRTVIPAARGRVRKGQLTCTVDLKPTPASRTYTVRLAYRHGTRPKITVIDPPLTLHPDANKLPHVYPGDELCLCYPGQWRQDDLLAYTVLPWTSEWLAHYELWLSTGQWSGGGHTHAHPQRPSTHNPADRASPYARRPSSETPAEAAR